MTRYRVAFQLYTSRNTVSVHEQLGKLAEFGYDAVESYGGAHGDDPAAFRKRLDELGLACPTAHIGLAQFDADVEAVIGLAHTLGLETAIIPYLAPDERPTDKDGWAALADRVAILADRFNAAGFGLGWHNHDFEYIALPDGTLPIDILLRAVNVKFEVDLGWTVRAGVEPIPIVDRYTTRIAAFHIKDVRSDASVEDGWAAPGEGLVDWSALLPSIRASSADLLIAEHDNPTDWEELARTALKFIRRLAVDMGSGSADAGHQY